MNLNKIILLFLFLNSILFAEPYMKKYDSFDKVCDFFSNDKLSISLTHENLKEKILKKERFLSKKKNRVRIEVIELFRKKNLLQFDLKKTLYESSNCIELEQNLGKYAVIHSIKRFDFDWYNEHFIELNKKDFYRFQTITAADVAIDNSLSHNYQIQKYKKDEEIDNIILKENKNILLKKENIESDDIVFLERKKISHYEKEEYWKILLYPEMFKENTILYLNSINTYKDFIEWESFKGIIPKIEEYFKNYNNNGGKINTRQINQVSYIYTLFKNIDRIENYHMIENFKEDYSNDIFINFNNRDYLIKETLLLIHFY